MNSPKILARSPGLQRVNYFSGQLITANDMTVEQEYRLEKLHRHNRLLHGWGVVCGCSVKPNPSADKPWQVRVCPGYVITPHGNEIYIGEPVDFDLAGDSRQRQGPCASPSPCMPATAGSQPGTKVYLAVCHTGCPARPVPMQPVGCACDEASCEYSRIRDTFELVRLSRCPESYRPMTPVDICTTTIPTCPPCTHDGCVVLAAVTLPDSGATPIRQDDISYDISGCYPSVAQVTQFAEVGVSVSRITVTFNKRLKAETVNTSTFLVSFQDSAGAHDVQGAVHYDDCSKLVTFIPAQGPLPPAIYNVTLVGTGSSPMLDIDGLAIDGDGDGTAGGNYTNQFQSR